MNSLGLIVHDEQSFLSKVVRRGTEDGILTRDRGDEILRISVAMANKYVLQKEIDFRSEDELSRVQAAILKLVGIGLEMKCKGAIDEGVRILMEASPVELFRLAHTRIDNLRMRWKKLLLNHNIQIMVSSEEFDCLSDLTCHLLSRMSIFSEREIYTIKSTTLEDELFNSLGILEYYETETERYEFILTLKEILPFNLLRKNEFLRAENISEVDSIREAMINTLVISHFNGSGPPTSVTTDEIRAFMASLDWDSEIDVFPEELESSVIEVIHELGQGLPESQASLLAKEVIRTIQRFVETIVREWDTVNSADEMVFFKRWIRMALVADSQGHVDRILSAERSLDEFEFESILDRLLRTQPNEAENMIEKLPWSHLKPDQIVRLFHDARNYQPSLASKLELDTFSTEELIDLVESLDGHTLELLSEQISKRLSSLDMRLEEIEMLASLHHEKVDGLFRFCKPPVDLDKSKILSEFKDGGLKIKKALFNCCINSEVFPDLFEEAWALNPEFIKKESRSIPLNEMGNFLLCAAGSSVPEILQSAKGEESLKFDSKQLSTFFNSLPVSKKKAAIKFFKHLKDPD